MKLSNTETIQNHTITETLGIARGSTVRSRNIGRDIFASLKNIVGGEIEEYTKLQADAREQALQRMISDAQKLGADAGQCSIYDLKRRKALKCWPMERLLNRNR